MPETGPAEDFLGVFGLLERRGAVLLAANPRRLSRNGPVERVFDLPGGGIERGETLREALVREWREETGLSIRVGEFLFLQEGRRIPASREGAHVWRSFFFEVEGDAFAARPSGEVEALCWCPRGRLPELLQAPYHAGFLRWIREGGRLQEDLWTDP